MYEEQDVLAVDAGNYGFIKLQWFDYHVFVPVLGTPIAELDYEDIFKTFPKEKQEELMKKKDYFLALCGEMQWE